MSKYFHHVNEVVKKVILVLESNKGSDYDPFLDQEFIYSTMIEQSANYAINHDWYNKSDDYYESILDVIKCYQADMWLLLSIAQMIAGESPSIKKSFDGMCVRDTFEDVVWYSFLNDVTMQIKILHPDFEEFNFCDRS